MKTISKKLLFASVCFVVLIVAAGAYGYVLYCEVSSLGSRLEDLQREISLLKYRIGFHNTSKTFAFFWGGPIAEKFNVTTFWMNVTFQRANETHLIVTVKVNDLAEGVHYFGMVFLDAPEYGYIYDPFYHYVPPDRTTKHYGAVASLLGPYREDGQRFFEIFASSYIDDLHTCDFDPELGYTYVIPIDLQKLKLTNDLVHVEYNATVSAEFSFGMELIA